MGEKLRFEGLFSKNGKVAGFQKSFQAPCGKLCGNCVKLLDLQAFAAFWLLFFACVKLVFSRGDRAFLKRIGLAVFPKCEKPFFWCLRQAIFAVCGAFLPAKYYFVRERFENMAKICNRP